MTILRKSCLLFSMITAMLIVSSCKEDVPNWKKHAFESEDMSRTAVESFLPRSLFEKMTSLLEAAQGEKGVQGASPAKGPLPSIFAPIRVYLVEKNKGILTHGHTEIIFPSGGGELDLREFIQRKKGSFFFAVEFMPDLKPAERHVYFLSHSPTRTLDGERYGAGCNKYFDISTAFNKAMLDNGFLVNTTAGRHISALGGSFYFAAVQDGKLLLASLTIKDSGSDLPECEKEQPDKAVPQAPSKTPAEHPSEHH